MIIEPPHVENSNFTTIIDQMLSKKKEKRPSAHTIKQFIEKLMGDLNNDKKTPLKITYNTKIDSKNYCTSPIDEKIFTNIDFYSGENLFDNHYCDNNNTISITQQNKTIKKIEEKYAKKVKEESDALQLN